MQTISTYDSFFQRFSLEFFGPNVDWLWFKAQGIAESGLNSLAVSPCGAKGLMQLMPGTSAEMAERLGIEDDPFEPHLNIWMGVGYDHYCWKVWKKEIGLERWRFMLAAYNAGVGNILRAQKLARAPAVWSSVADELPKITGERAGETITYIRRIEGYYADLAKDANPQF